MITNISKQSIENQIDFVQSDIKHARQTIKKFKRWLLFWQTVTAIAVISLIMTIGYADSAVDKIFLSLIGFVSLMCAVVSGAFWAEMQAKIRVMNDSIQIKQQKLRKLWDEKMLF